MRERRKVMRSAVAFTAALGLGAATLAAAPAIAQEGEGPLAHYLFDQHDGQEVANAAGDAFGPAAVVRGQEGDWTDTSLTLRGGPKDGSGNFVRLPDEMLIGAESATISIEVKPSQAALDGWHFLWNFGGQTNQDEYFFSSLNQAQGSRTPLVGIKDAGDERLLQSSRTLAADEWVNVTSVIDGEANQAHFYIDGNLVMSGAMPHSPGAVEDQTFNTIGYAPWPDPLFAGEVASFRVYDRALGADEVASVERLDAEIHAEAFAAEAQGLVDALDIESEITTNTDIDLPTGGGKVTWTSSDESVVAADGTVFAPVEGGDAASATLTATADVRGYSAERVVDVTVTPSDESAQERIDRLAQRFVLPHVLASGVAIPAAPHGTVIDAVDTSANYADGVLTGSGETTVDVTFRDEATGATTVRSFEVDLLDDARELLAYDRNPTNAGEANNADIARSMHLALDGEPLFHGYGIFFAHIVEPPGPRGTRSDQLRSLIDPHVAYLDDRTFGVMSTRQTRGGGNDGTQASSVLLAQTDNLLDYTELGLLNLGVTSGVNEPAFAYDQTSGHYVVTWKNDVGAPYWATFDSFSVDAEVSAPVRGHIDLIGADAEGDISAFRSGNVLPVTHEVARGLEIRFNPIRNTDASWNDHIALQTGDAFDASALSEKIDLVYDDGSTNDLAIEWDAEAIAAIDTSQPGTYEVPGTVRQAEYHRPLADERADPMIVPFDFNGEQKFLMIATKDLHLDPTNNSGQPTGMPLRMADTIEELADEEKGLEIEVDLLKRGDRDVHHGTQYEGGIHDGVMTGCFWAPEIHTIDGKLSILFMPCYGNNPHYMSGRASIIQLMQDDEGNHLDPSDPASWTQTEHVLRADGSPLNDLEGISLDMSFIVDEGQGYYTWQMLGSVFIAKMDPSNPTRLTSDPVRIIAPEYAWDNMIAEGQNLFIRDGKVFMPYAASLVGDTYTTGLAWAESGADLTDPSVWERHVYPLHKSEPFEGEWLLGPGHGAWSYDADGNQIWVFHVRTHNKGLGGRDAFVHRVHWTSQGLPRFNMEREHELAPQFREVTTTVEVSGSAGGSDAVAEFLFVEEPADGVTVPNTGTGDGEAIVNGEAEWDNSSLVFNGDGTSQEPGDGTWVALPDDILVDVEQATIVTEFRADEEILNSWNFLWQIGGDNTSEHWFASARNSPRTVIKANGMNEAQASAPAIESDRWYSLASVIDGETISTYLDGKLVGQATTALTPADIAEQTMNTIGRAPYPDPLFAGAVSTFRAFDRALSAEEIDQINVDDAQIHADEISGYSATLLESIAPIELSDTHTQLPTYGGAVTWASQTDLVDINGAAAVAQLPAAGEDAAHGTLVASATVRGVTVSIEVDVTLVPQALPTDDYGYLMVHFIEDSAGYAEKIHLSVSRGNNPEQWDRLNGGEPILGSHLSTTGVRDPYITYSPETEKYYILGTDLRVFGGDDAGWGGWTDNYSTKINIWESDDLITWSEQRQFDVALDSSGEPDTDAPYMGMMWAPEATWVDDFYGEGDGAFVMYWSSMGEGDKNYHRVMWGATRDFTQDTWEFGGAFVDDGHFTIDTTMTQNDGKTYRVTKDNTTGRGLFMEVTDAERWWEDGTEWTVTQEQIGAEYAGGNPGGVEGPAIFQKHGEDVWYLYADVIPDIGYQPLISTDLDADEPWQLLDSPDFDLAPSTKHGGVIGLTKAQYDEIRQADAASVSAEVSAEVATGSDEDAIAAALPAEVAANLHFDRGTASFPVVWDIADVDTSTEGTFTVSGVLAGTLGANLNAWVGDDGSTEWDAEGKTPFSSTELTVEAEVSVVEGEISRGVPTEADLTDENRDPSLLEDGLEVRGGDALPATIVNREGQEVDAYAFSEPTALGTFIVEDGGIAPVAPEELEVGDHRFVVVYEDGSIAWDTFAVVTADAGTDADADAQAGSDAGASGDSDAGADAEAGSDAGASGDSDAGADAETGSDAGASGDSDAGADAVAGSDAGASGDSDAGADAVAGSDAGASGDSDAGADAEAGSDAGASGDSDAGADAEAGSDAGASGDSDAGADAEAGSDAGASAQAGSDGTPGPGGADADGDDLAPTGGSIAAMVIAAGLLFAAAGTAIVIRRRRVLS
ncbi:LamG-like jellyroll fold domain-containing protein [Microbacterium amylolyticum]|uniref:GH43 family beta-xylosidase n=1 Tax=Microbacterium amylolyticum TaxID=936337 RepID=A0ABS4ZIR1_9MICO|nr:LamG-like jellyroll fold domain-containing protein [Microbacterium amylolyticum]MBP2437154.1 GH43 family beta-xylosidase [Microbacterium amylolyticum]